MVSKIKEFWSLHRAKKTYKEGKNYYGTFPEGFIKKVKETWPKESNGKVVQLFGGQSDFGETFDINPNTNPTHNKNAMNNGLPDNYADFVICDPPYEDSDWLKYGTSPISIDKILKEAVRITKPDGLIGFLHFILPSKPKGTKLERIVAISTGPDRRIRGFMVWRKQNISNKIV